MILITAEEARKITKHKTTQTVYRWAKRGWIKKYPYGTRAVRFDLEEIKSIAEQGLIIFKEGKPRSGPSHSCSRKRRKRLWDK